MGWISGWLGAVSLHLRHLESWVVVVGLENVGGSMEEVPRSFEDRRLARGGTLSTF